MSSAIFLYINLLSIASNFSSSTFEKADNCNKDNRIIYLVLISFAILHYSNKTYFHLNCGCNLAIEFPFDELVATKQKTLQNKSVKKSKQ